MLINEVTNCSFHDSDGDSPLLILDWLVDKESSEILLAPDGWLEVKVGQHTHVPCSLLPHSDEALDLCHAVSFDVPLFDESHSLQTAFKDWLDLASSFVIFLFDVLLFYFEDEITFVYYFKLWFVTFFTEIISHRACHVYSVVMLCPAQQLFSALFLSKFLIKIENWVLYSWKPIHVNSRKSGAWKVLVELRLLSKLHAAWNTLKPLLAWINAKCADRLVSANTLAFILRNHFFNFISLLCWRYHLVLSSTIAFSK